MKRMSWIFMSAALMAAIFLPSKAMAATYDLTGEWTYAFSDKTVQGVCPLGPLNQGTLQIEQNGDTATLVLLTGGECSPASMCTFSCTISEDEYTCSNSDVVDNEGGVAENTVTLTATSANDAAGPAFSTYTLGEVQCRWDYQVSISRQGEGPTQPDTKDDSGGCSMTPWADGSRWPTALFFGLLVLGLMLILRSRRRDR